MNASAGKTGLAVAFVGACDLQGQLARGKARRQRLAWLGLGRAAYDHAGERIAQDCIATRERGEGAERMQGTGDPGQLELSLL